MDCKITVCTLIAWGMWSVGMVGFTLISLGLIDSRHTGVGLAAIIGGSTIYVRYLVRVQRRREDAAFEMGRLSAGGEARPALHRVL